MTGVFFVRSGTPSLFSFISKHPSSLVTCLPYPFFFFPLLTVVCQCLHVFLLPNGESRVRGLEDGGLRDSELLWTTGRPSRADTKGNGRAGYTGTRSSTSEGEETSEGTGTRPLGTTSVHWSWSTPPPGVPEGKGPGLEPIGCPRSGCVRVGLPL